VGLRHVGERVRLPDLDAHDPATDDVEELARLRDFVLTFSDLCEVRGV